MLEVPLGVAVRLVGAGRAVADAVKLAPPVPATDACASCRPAVPTVQDASTRPAASVVVGVGVRDPPPSVAAQSTRTSGTGLPCLSRTLTTRGAANRWLGKP